MSVASFLSLVVILLISELMQAVSVVFYLVVLLMELQHLGHRILLSDSIVGFILRLYLYALFYQVDLNSSHLLC